MLEPRFIVDDHIAVVARIFVDLGLEDAVDKAVAALALRPAHDKHVKIVLFDERRAEFHLGVVGLCHIGRHGALLLGAGHLLADIAQRRLDLHAQHLVEVGVGVGVDDQNGALFLLTQIVDNHAAGCRLADTALTGNCDGMCRHRIRSFRTLPPAAFAGKGRRKAVVPAGRTPAGHGVNQTRSMIPDSLAM